MALFPDSGSDSIWVLVLMRAARGRWGRAEGMPRGQAAAVHDLGPTQLGAGSAAPHPGTSRKTSENWVRSRA